jgi:hypothetical protein
VTILIKSSRRGETRVAATGAPKGTSTAAACSTVTRIGEEAATVMSGINSPTPGVRGVESSPGQSYHCSWHDHDRGNVPWILRSKGRWRSRGRTFLNWNRQRTATVAEDSPSPTSEAGGEPSSTGVTNATANAAEGSPSPTSEAGGEPSSARVANATATAAEGSHSPAVGASTPRSEETIVGFQRSRFLV